MLELAERFVDTSLRAGAPSSPEDAECLLKVSRDIQSAMLLVKEQLA